jgi:hypothetical protein
VSARERIAKLEALLHRVRARAAEPRSRRVAVSAPIQELGDDEFDTVATIPPPAHRAPEVSAPPAEHVESRSRLIASEPVSAPVESPDAELAATQEMNAAHEAFLAEAAAGEAAEEAAEERPPASSRRPVAMADQEPARALEEMAFGEEAAPPRHTPPPESGRLPAAPVVEFDPDITGVREAGGYAAKSAPPIEPEIAEQTRPEAFSGGTVEVMPREPAAPPVSAMQPHVTRAEIEPSGRIAEYVSAPTPPASHSFAELLDSALDL